MYKDIVIKLLKNQPVNDAELNEFIVTYIKNKKNIDVTPEQLTGIRQLIAMRIFNLNNAVLEEMSNLKLGRIIVTDLNTNQILKINVYEIE